MVNRRGAAASVALLAWAAGLALFLRREAAEGPAQRLADVGARIAPGVIWFSVERDGRQVGFASVTIDTLPRELQVTEYLLVEEGDAARRHSSELTAHFSRGLDLHRFRRVVATGSDSQRITGIVVDDSSVSVERVERARRDSGTISHRGEALVPPLIPLVAMLRERPKRGRETSFDVFELDDLTRRLVTVQLDAESMFVVPDSAVFDDLRARWIPAHRDSIHGWHLTGRSGMAVDLWTDDQGRVLAARRADGLVLRRTAFEIAFENWRNSRSEVGGRRPPASVLRPPTSDLRRQ